MRPASRSTRCASRQGFTGDTPPQALLYMLLQFALSRGYLDAGDRLRRGSGLFAAELLLAMRREPTSVHVRSDRRR